jgi:hypothetical protein
MHFRRRGEQSVDERRRVKHAQERPGFNDWLVDREDPVSEPRPHLREPAVQGGGLFGITAAFQFQKKWREVDL